MAKKIQIAVLGGDARQVSAAEWLVEHGCQVSAWGLCDMSTAVEVCESPDAAIREAEVLLLPIPLSRDQLWVNGTSLSVSTLSSILRPGMTVLCGMPNSEWIADAEQRNVEVIDYSRDEIFMIRNALPTAEGAVAIAMNEMRRTLFDSNIMVVGYGRIGKLLADLLIRIGANVTVAARKSADLATAELHGCKTCPLLCTSEDEAYSMPVLRERYHVIFNTVPFPLIEESVLESLATDTVLIDLASAPGGIDYDAANRLGLKTVVALSLPGKVAPVTAGEIIGECVLRYCGKRGRVL